MIRGLVYDGVRSSKGAEVNESSLDTKTNSRHGLGSPDNKRMKFLLDPNQQQLTTYGDDFKSVKRISPLGLKLTITPSFLNQLNIVCSRARNISDSSHALSRGADMEKVNHFVSQSQNQSEKLKASNFPASRLIIGTYKRGSVHESDLIAKCYYATRKLVWEVLEGHMKSKMEMQWSHIEAIRATIHENEPGILEIELNQQPVFSKEINPQPRKHTLWQTSSDFTGGQALICRRHRVEFPPGILEKHYEKLLQCDQRLLELSRKPFPSGKCPHFHPNSYYWTNNNSSNISSRQSELFPSPHAYHNLDVTTNSTLQGMDFEQEDENVKSYIYANQGEIAQHIYVLQDQIQGLVLPATKDPFEGHNQKNSQFIQGEDDFAQAKAIHSLIDSSKINTINYPLEYIQDNFGNDNSLSGTSENFDPDGGVNWSPPINWMPTQVFNDHVVTENGYQCTFFDRSVGDYGVVNNGYPQM